MSNQCYIDLKDLRGSDVFPVELAKEKMIDLFFPKSPVELALDLSNVTSAFYGVMLKSCGQAFGMQKIDTVSKSFFYNLGKLKAKATLEKVSSEFKVYRDARGIIILLISAIYNASPEYKFQVLKYSENHCEIVLSGCDRYYRITKDLGIEKNLEWPVLHNFMHGLKDELSINARINSQMICIEDSECIAKYNIITEKD